MTIWDLELTMMLLDTGVRLCFIVLMEVGKEILNMIHLVVAAFSSLIVLLNPTFYFFFFFCPW